MEQQKSRCLTSPEIGALWSQYMNDSMVICVLQYFAAKSNDEETRTVIEFALGLSQKNIQDVTQIFKQEGMSIPVGFTNKDVNVDAPQLYSDILYLRYIKHLSTAGMTGYSLSVALAVRSDVRNHFLACNQSTMELDEKVTQMLLSKGLYIRAPYIPLPQEVMFVESPTFMGSLLGKNRPLNVLEIMLISANVSTNAMSRALMLGLSQVAQSPDVREFLVRGQDICKKHIKVFSTLLQDDDLPTPTTWDSEVQGATTPPFSDKMMMQQVTALVAVGLANYGMALGYSTRVDVAADYVRLMAETGQLGEDGAHIMIKHGWMEQPPQAVDRKKLSS